MKLFPWTLVRMAGASLSRLDDLRARRTHGLADDLHERSASLRSVAGMVCDELYAAIGRLGETGDRGLLVSLKRDVFNLREIETAKLDRCATWLEADLVQRIQTYSTLRKQCEDLRREARSCFGEELEATQSALKRLAADDLFRCGLLLSSRVLLEATEKLLERDTSPGGDRQIELSLAKYLTRMLAKTSPFSTYTHITLGAVVPQLSPWIDAGAPSVAEADVESHIRVNHYLFEYLQRLCRALPAICRRLPLRVNPSLSIRDGEYYFLINDNNIESFQRAPLDPMIDWVLELIRSRPDGRVVWKDLVESIRDEDEIEGTEDEIDAYLGQLVDLGFLQLDFEVSGLDPAWDTGFREYLETYTPDVHEARRIVTALSMLAKLAQEYAAAGVDRRSDILGEAFAAFTALDRDLGGRVDDVEDERREEAAEAPDPEPADAESVEDFVFTRRRSLKHDFTPVRLFYEDVTTSRRLRLDRAQVEAFVDRVSDLIRRLDVLSPFRDEMQRMRTFHREHYGNESVGALHFYEDYFRHTKGGGTPANGPAEIGENIERAQAWLAGLRRHLASRLSDEPETVRLTAEDLARAGDDPTADHGQCHCFYVQFLLDSEGSRRPLRGVVNHGNVLPGHGKGFSRFLEPYDEVLESLRRWNEPSDADVLYVENCDGSFFNANIHPPLLRWELAIPESQNGQPPDRQIPVTDLEVEPAEDELVLRYVPTGQRVYILDLGFQTKGRSPLFHLLNNFSPTSYVPFRPLLEAVDGAVRKVNGDAGNEEAERVRKRPRVVYEDRVILQRRGWIVPPTRCPRLDPEESEADYFLRVDSWRRELGMPAEVFVRVRDRSTRGLENYDDRKPQYLHFGSPILLRLFERLLQRVDRDLLIEEMLPERGDLLDLDGEPRVTELVLECRL